jgi:hypothetical protein
MVDANRDGRNQATKREIALIDDERIERGASLPTIHSTVAIRVGGQCVVKSFTVAHLTTG